MFKTKRRNLMFVLLVAGLCLSVSAAITSVQYPYQGRLTDNGGQPLTGSYSLSFSIYDVAVGGAALWTESHSPVSVVDGLFNVQLGSIVTIDPSLFDGSARYLGITVGADAELAPRTVLGATPYASRAATVDGFSSGSENTVSGLNGFAAGDSNTVLTDFGSIAGGIGNLVDLTNIADSTFDTTGLLDPPLSSLFDPSEEAAMRDFALFPCVYPPWWTPNFIGGGWGNTAIGNGSGVTFGGNNTASGGFSAVVGGGANYAEGDFSFIGGGFCNQALVQGKYQVIGGGYRNHAYGTVTTIGGGAYNSVANNFTGITIGGGYLNRANQHVSTIGGGYLNATDGFGATVSGGRNNLALNDYATVGGGRTDTASGMFATVAGGENNHAVGTDATVGGGNTNRVEGFASTIAGGEGNLAATHPHQFIGGGLGNNTTDPFATIAGGTNNVASTWATVGGGESNASIAEHTFVGGGRANVSNGSGAAIGGGFSNQSGAYAAAITGGELNHALGIYSTIGGGWDNFASADTTFIGGGSGNVASGNAAVVVGGQLNMATASVATVGGGRSNGVVGLGGVVGGGVSNRVGPGAYSTVPGGFQNGASASMCFAAGTNANADDNCSFIWSDCCEDASGMAIPFYTFLPKTFNARATNGFYFLTGCDSAIAPGSGQAGVFVPAGGSMWTSLSSRTMKKNITLSDNRSILQKVADLPIYRWTYNTQDDIRHIGPMAEDFYATFGLGESDKTISTLDPAGVALAAIKELAQKAAEVDELKKQLNDVNDKMARMEAQISQILAAQNMKSKGSDEIASK